jgi:repressor LexA
MKPNFDTQEELLSKILKLTAEIGYPPTVRELCSAMGYRSSCTIFRKLEKLKELGLISWEKGKPRTLRVIQGQK